MMADCRTHRTDFGFTRPLSRACDIFVIGEQAKKFPDLIEKFARADTTSRIIPSRIQLGVSGAHRRRGFLPRSTVAMKCFARFQQISFAFSRAGRAQEFFCSSCLKTARYVFGWLDGARLRHGATSTRRSRDADPQVLPSGRDRAAARRTSDRARPAIQFGVYRRNAAPPGRGGLQLRYSGIAAVAHVRRWQVRRGLLTGVAPPGGFTTCSNSSAEKFP